MLEKNLFNRTFHFYTKLTGHCLLLTAYLKEAYVEDEDLPLHAGMVNREGRFAMTQPGRNSRSKRWLQHQLIDTAGGRHVTQKELWHSGRGLRTRGDG